MSGGVEAAESPFARPPFGVITASPPATASVINISCDSLGSLTSADGTFTPLERYPLGICPPPYSADARGRDSASLD